MKQAHISFHFLLLSFAVKVSATPSSPTATWIELWTWKALLLWTWAVRTWEEMLIIRAWGPHELTTTLLWVWSALKDVTDMIFIFYACNDASVFGHQRGVLYQGLHSGGSMVAMGKAGLLSHSLGGYGLPSPGASGTSAVYHLFYGGCFLDER